MKNLLNKIDRIQEDIKKTEVHRKQKFFLNEMKKVGIEKLPYAYTALKRFIDAETMDVHYNKHYKGYVEKLNLALDKKNFGDLDLEHIVKTISKFSDEVRNNAGGAYNHALFWKMLSPKEQKPKGLVLKRIEKDFGSVASFKKKFDEEAKKRFGSGWVWLVVTKNNRLKIMSTPNQDNPLMNDIESGGYPILGLDLWEHAFYLKYKNQKNEYIKNFWKVVNWEFVEKLYKMKLNTKINEEIILHQLMESTSEKKILKENLGISKFCTRDESKKILQLLSPDTGSSNEAYKFKPEFIKGWTNILKQTYPEKWKEENELFPNILSDPHQAGIYSDDNVRDLLNNITSNYVAFCVIIKDINQQIPNPIKFGNDPEKNLSELKRFFDILEQLKEEYFDKEEKSDKTKKVRQVLTYTHCLGLRNEDAAMKIINQRYGEGICTLKSGLGFTKDMKLGIDAELYSRTGNKETAQIKGYKNSETFTSKNGEEYDVINGSTLNRMYSTVTYLIFVNLPTRTVLIYKTKETIDNETNKPITNKRIHLKDNKYYIPKEFMVDKIVGDGNIEFIDCNKILEEQN